jgi:hypothetical protein
MAIDLRGATRFLGYKIVQLAELGRPRDALDLSGDRDVEWAWVAANLPEAPGRVLDFGPASSWMGLVAAFKGGSVSGLDLTPLPLTFAHPGHEVRAGDVLTYPFGETRFDTIINCSTTEHVGLGGRYGGVADPDGDLKAMARLREIMAGESARMILTVPVGRDGAYAPWHRVYGEARLPRLLAGFRPVREEYFAKRKGDNRWQAVPREEAVMVESGPRFYGLGLFVLSPA